MAGLKNLTPVRLGDGSPELYEAVAQLYNHVLPNISRAFVRKFIRARGVQTLLLIHPQGHQPNSGSRGSDSDRESDMDDVSGDEELESEDEDSGDEARLLRQADKGGTADTADAADGPGAGGATGMGRAPAAVGTGREAASEAMPVLDSDEVRALRRRLVGAVSYEFGSRLGQQIVQVSLLSVRSALT